MATRTPTVVPVEGDMATYRVTWAGLLNGDDGAPVPDQYGLYVNRSVQVKGTLGSGGAVTIEGSNDPAAPTYNTLNDCFNNPLVMTALAIKQVLEIPSLTRPRVTAGDGTTNLTVVMLIKVDNLLRQ